MVSSTEEQSKKIKKYFNKILAPENKNDVKTLYNPCLMSKLFTKKEISEAANGLKNGRSAGIDKYNNELIKYTANDIDEQIAEIFNHMARTGELPSEIKNGLLTPLQKPGFRKNLRPIVLLSVIKKILAICLIKRCWSKLKSQIPPAQAAYLPGRSTAEHALTIKQVVEKTMQLSKYKTYILMLDMC